MGAPNVSSSAGAPSWPVCPHTHHDCAVLGATGNDIIIVWAPGDVQHWGRVATDHRHVLVHTSSLEDTAGPLREVFLPSKADPTSPLPSTRHGEKSCGVPGRQSRAWGGRVWSSAPAPELSGQLSSAGWAQGAGPALPSEPCQVSAISSSVFHPCPTAGYSHPSFPR